MLSVFSTQPPADTILHPGRIDVWQFSLNQAVSYEAFALLSPEEAVRAKQFYFARHQRRFTNGRATLRRILGHYLHQKPQTIAFNYNPQGKPFLSPDSTTLQFNLSHSGELALLAVGSTHAVGVDLEFFSPRPYAGIGQELFSSTENLALAQLPIGLQTLGFFCIWSQKEALIKAVGRGLSYPTQHLSFPVLSTTPFTFHDPNTNSHWRMHPFMPSLSCCAALCCHPSIESIHYMQYACS